MRIVVAVTGASGSVLAVRLLEELRSHEVHLVLTDAARRVTELEVGRPNFVATRKYSDQDLGAPISSTSFPLDAMVVIPCSMKTLSAIARGYSGNLVTRAADNILRMRKPLILVPRETPLSLNAIENMYRACLAGASILPPTMAYYFHPQTVDDVTDFFVGKALDLLGLPHHLYDRWAGAE